jgi:nitrate reductase NapAB chaperone NapD
MMVSKLSRRELVSLHPRTPARASDIVHIASLLVQTTHEGMMLAKHAAAALPGAEIHDTAAPGKFVVVLESSQERAIADAAELLLQVAGVLTVSIVTHMMESAADLQREA